MSVRWLKSFLVFGALALVQAAHSAQLGPMLDDIDVVEHDGEAEIRIALAAPVMYRTHAPRDEGQMLHIYFTLATFGTPDERAVRPEYRPGPPNKIVPHFYVLYVDPGIDRNAQLIVQFQEPVRFALREGKDARSFIITVRKKSDGRAPASR